MFKQLPLVLLGLCFVTFSGAQAISSTELDKAKYQVVIDSGSSGNRAYLYHVTGDAAYPQITPLFEATNSLPLAGFAEKPESAGMVTIQPLLQQVKQVLHEKYNIPANEVVVNDLGTAGMRLIPESAQQVIYQNVAKVILASGFMLGKTATITGQQEGVYAWIDVNYLTGLLKSGHPNGVLDMGGASAQIVFNSSPNQDNPKLLKLCANGIQYNLYAVSYLGLGKNQARKAMDAGKDFTACYPQGYNAGKFNFANCSANYAQVLAKPEYFTLGKIKSVPDFARTTFIGVDNIHKIFKTYDLASKPDHLQLESVITQQCSLSYSALQNKYPSEKQLERQCANSVYLNSFLYKSLQLSDTQLKVESKINGARLTWTLGYLFANLTQSLASSCK